MRLRPSASQCIGVSRAVLARSRSRNWRLDGARGLCHGIARRPDAIAHQACHRDHRRESQFRSRLRHLCARGNQFVWNLFSEGIVNNDGTPAPISPGHTERGHRPCQRRFSAQSRRRRRCPTMSCPRRWWVARRTPTLPATACRWPGFRERLARRLLPLPVYRRHRPDIENAGHTHHQRQRASARSLSATNGKPSPTTPTPPVPCIASTRCGSSWIAA